MIAVFEKAEIRKHAVPLTIEQYHTLVNEGSFSNDIEFIRGALIEKMSKSPLHEYIIAKLIQAITPLLGREFLLRKEGPISTRDSEPEPDISIVKGSPDDFLTKHPSTAEFVAEVAVTSQDIDFAKADIYAEAGIPVYALIDAKACVVHLHTKPKEGRYAEVTLQTDNMELGLSGAKIDLKSVFPEAP